MDQETWRLTWKANRLMAKEIKTNTVRLFAAVVVFIFVYLFNQFCLHRTKPTYRNNRCLQTQNSSTSHNNNNTRTNIDYFLNCFHFDAFSIPILIFWHRQSNILLYGIGDCNWLHLCMHFSQFIICLSLLTRTYTLFLLVMASILGSWYLMLVFCIYAFECVPFFMISSFNCRYFECLWLPFSLV